MSDINRKGQVAATAEADDLSALAASKDLHNVGQALSRNLAAPANSTDLATASISPADVMRVAHRSEGGAGTRIEIGRAAGELHNAQGISVSLTNKQSRAVLSRGAASEPHGILKNPFYRYDGGLLNKVLALIGNILKVIERIILRLLGARDSTPSHNQTNTSQQKKASPQGEERQHDLEREKRKERREQAEQLVKRQ